MTTGKINDKLTAIGEGAAAQSVTVMAPANGTLNVQVLAPSDGVNFYRYRYTAVYRTTSTDVTALGAAVQTAGYTGDYNPVLNFAVTAGQTYKIRAAANGSNSGRYRLQLTLS